MKTLWSGPARLANLCLSLAMSLLFSQAQQALATTDFSADLVLGQENFTLGNSNRGTSPGTLNLPRGVAAGAGRVYVADTGNNRVLWWNSTSFANGQPADGVIGQPDMGHDTVNTLSSPNSVAVDSEGNVWVADTENYRVLKFAPPTTNNPDAILVIGQPDMTIKDSNIIDDSHFYPLDIAVDAAGNLWVADGNGDRALRFDTPSANGQSATLVIGQPDFTTHNTALISNFCGITLDQGGDLWMADDGYNRVLKFAAPLSSGQSPSLVLGQTGIAGTSSGLSAYSLSKPSDLTMDKNGDLWVVDTYNNRVLKYVSPSTSGQAAAIVLGEANMTSRDGGLSATRQAQPKGVAADADGNIWVADTNNKRVLKYMPPFSSEQAATAVLGQLDMTSRSPTHVGADTLAKPTYVTIGDGRLYASDYANRRTLWWELSALKNAANAAAANGVIGQPNMTALGSIIDDSHVYPNDIAVDGAGNLWVADTGHNRVLKFAKPSSNGPSAVLVLGQADMTHGNVNRGNTAPAANSLSNSEGLAFDKDGNLWVSDSSNNRVLKYMAPFSTGQAASLVLGQADMEHGDANRGAEMPSPLTLNSPRGLAFDKDGNLWVADYSNNRVLKYMAPFSTGQAASLVLGQPDMVSIVYSGASFSSLNNPQSVKVDAYGNLWVTDSGANRVLRYANPTYNAFPADRVIGQADMTGSDIARNMGNPVPNGLQNPTGVAVDDDGIVWVADLLHNRILRFTLQQNVNGNISSGGNGLAGVTVTASGHTSSTTVTDSLGNYTLKLIDGEAATLTPSKTNYTFTPPTLSTAALADDWQGNNFSAALATHTVSGSVVEGSAPLAGVIISVSGSTATFSTDNNGNYSLPLAEGGSYTLVPSLPGYSFTPPSISTSALSADWTGIAFTAIRNTLSASGTVLSGGKPLPEMTVTISGVTIGSAKTDASGRFAFALAPGGAYTITPSMTGYSFTPPSVSTVSLAAAWTADFTATPSYTLSGLVKAGGAALAGALISISGDTTASVTTDSTGRYTLALAPGNYVLKPSRAGYYFDPPYHAVTPLSADTVLDFTSGGMDGKSAVVEGGPNGYVEPKKGPAKIRLVPPQSGHVTIKAYTLRNARLVATLEADVNAGEVSTIIWDCLNTDGEMLGSGIYMLNINGAGYSNHKIKMGVLK